ncbi:MAG: DUF535 family protein [Granulosicoccaceae bacterium]
MSGSNTNEQEQQQSVWEYGAYVSRLPLIASSLYPDASPIRRIKKSAVFCINGIRQKRKLQQIQKVFDCPELAEVLKLFPAILDKPFDPYVCVDWAVGERTTQIQSHFQYLKATFGENTAQIYKPEGYRLFDFVTKEDERFFVQLFPGYQCEGSIGIRLCDSEAREVYTLSFHLSTDAAPVCYIGALQGPNDKVPDRQKTIVSLTRSLHGLRPKALMVETLCMVMRALEIDLIYGVSNAGHIYQSDQYTDEKRAKVEFDFDQLWNEFNAEKHTASFYKLLSEPERKDASEIKPKKRSLYRKRYQWLDETANCVQEAIKQLRLKPYQSGVPELKKNGIAI